LSRRHSDDEIEPLLRSSNSLTPAIGAKGRRRKPSWDSEDELAELERLLLITGKSPSPIRNNIKQSSQGSKDNKDKTNAEPLDGVGGGNSPVPQVQQKPIISPPSHPESNTPLPRRQLNGNQLGRDLLPDGANDLDISQKSEGRTQPGVNPREAISSFLEDHLDPEPATAGPVRQALSPKFSSLDPLEKPLIPPGEFEAEVRKSYQDALRVRGKRLLKTQWDRRREELRVEARRRMQEDLDRSEKIMLERVRREGFSDVDLARIETELNDKRHRLKQKLEKEHNRVVDLISDKVLEQRELHLDEERMALVNSFSMSTSDILGKKQHELKAFSERRLQALQRRLQKEQEIYLESERRRMRADTDVVLEANSQKLLTDRRQQIHNLRETFMQESRKLLHEVEREARKQHAHMGESLVEVHRAKRWGERAKLEKGMQEKVASAVQRIQSRVDVYASRGEEILKQEAAAELRNAIHKLRMKTFADNEEHLHHISSIFKEELKRLVTAKMSFEDFDDSHLKTKNEALKLSQAFDEMKANTRQMGQRFVDLTIESVLLAHDLSYVGDIGSLWENGNEESRDTSSQENNTSSTVDLSRSESDDRFSNFMNKSSLNLSKDYWR